MATQAASDLLTYEEFLQAYEGAHVEWVAGQVVPMTPVTPRNQFIANFLVSVLQHLFDRRGTGVVLSAPVQMKCGESAREPDVMVLSRDHSDRVKASYVEGPADLVIEVISPDSRVRDRGEKFYEYEQAGVPEYWLIDPTRRKAEQYRLDGSGTYEPVPPSDPPRLRSELLDELWIDPAWLWSEPLPRLDAVLEEWGLR
jgi:Uma2 family endonuclease